MKKALALTLALLMVLSFFACANSNTVPPSANEVPSPSTPAASFNTTERPATTAEPSTYVPQGYYDANYDYGANKPFKTVYMMSSSSALQQMASDSFKAWSKLMNCDYSDFSANGDNELFIVTLQTFIDQGYDGVLLDPDVTIWPRVVEVLSDSKTSWMPLMTVPVNLEGKQAHPCTNADMVEWGRRMARWVVDYANKNWPNAKPSEIGMISITFSAVPQFTDRTTGEQEIWNQAYPDVPDNFFIADAITTQRMDAETGYNLTAAIMSANADIQYWMICGCFDDYAQGGARAAEDALKQDTTVAVSCGGTNLIANWDQGIQSPWKSALYAAQPLITEPVLGALYSFMNGQATPETIWPEWVDHSKDEKYATIEIPVQMITKDNYQEYMEWVDAFTGMDNSNYPYNGTQFSAVGEIPASFAG